MRRSRARWHLACALLLSCGAPPAPKPVAKPSTVTTAARPPLLDHVPSAGLRWLVVGRPAELEKRPDLLSLLAPLFPAVRLDAFRKVTGIDLAKVRIGAVAGFQVGTLYLAKLGEPSASDVRERFAERLDEGGIARHPHPAMHRISGTSNASPRALLTVDDDFVAVAVDDVVLVKIVEAYAARRLRSPSALRGAALRDLPALPDDALLALYAAGPFPEELARAAHGVLGQTSSLVITVSGGAKEELVVTVTLVGDYSPDPSEAATRLGSAFQELCASSTGTLIGLSQTGSPKIVADLHHLTLTAGMPLGPLARGLRAATQGNIHEIFDLVPLSPAGEPAQTP
jgi:hypothetical protein